VEGSKVKLTAAFSMVNEEATSTQNASTTITTQRNVGNNIFLYLNHTQTPLRCNIIQVFISMIIRGGQIDRMKNPCLSSSYGNQSPPQFPQCFFVCCFSCTPHTHTHTHTVSHTQPPKLQHAFLYNTPGNNGLDISVAITRWIIGLVASGKFLEQNVLVSACCCVCVRLRRWCTRLNHCGDPTPGTY
jgi:hypothetical protein